MIKRLKSLFTKYPDVLEVDYVEHLQDRVEYFSTALKFKQMEYNELERLYKETKQIATDQQKIMHSLVLELRQTQRILENLRK